MKGAVYGRVAELDRKIIIDKLAEILAAENEEEAAEKKEYTEDMGLYTDIGLNSIGLLYMVISVEEAFNIRFENVKMTDFTVLKDVVDYIEKAVKV